MLIKIKFQYQGITTDFLSVSLKLLMSLRCELCDSCTKERVFDLIPNLEKQLEKQGFNPLSFQVYSMPTLKNCKI